MNTLVLYVFTVLNTLAAGKADSVAYPQGYFRAPLDIPLTLAGNFGEPRRLHFHTGLDFRTNQQEGLKVYAVADGYVSRVNVSGAGYGNALYIRHPNGWVSVYGHLKSYSKTIEERLRKEQYAKESFAVDFNPKPGEIPVKKGEVIALSGNTGGSGGPHLHFEIRDTLDHPYNPMLFGFNLKDEVKPTVGYIKFYALDSTKHTSAGYRLKLTGKEGVYTTTEPVIKLNALQAGFALNTYDLMNLSENHLGVYNITVFDGNTLLYEFQPDHLAFNDKRYVLSHIDYPIFMNETRKIFHRCYTQPGNKCPVYPAVHNNGVIDLSDGKVHNINVEVHDFYGNVSMVKLNLQYSAASTAFKPVNTTYNTVFAFDKENKFEAADLRLNIPPGCLFDDVYFTYSASLTSDLDVYSKIHRVGSSETQSFDWFTIWVRAEKLPDGLQDKAVLMYKDDAGATACRSGKLEDGMLVAKVRDFGRYYIKADTIPPKIQPVNIVAGRNMRQYKKITLKIYDTLSGVADFDTYMNDQWVVTEYDAKTSTLTHFINPALPAGQHTFKTVVTDERGNRAEYAVKFLW